MCTRPATLTAGSKIPPTYDKDIPVNATALGRLNDRARQARLQIDKYQAENTAATGTESSADAWNLSEVHRRNGLIENLTAIICEELGLTADNGKLPKVYVDQDWMAYTA